MASRNDWPILYDASCQFGHAELSKLLSLWRSMTGRGGIPRRRDMTARLLRPYMRMLSLYERVLADDGARRHRVRLMGSAVVQVLGELTGHFLDEVVPEEFLPRWCPMIDVPLAAGAPMRLLNSSRYVQQKPYRWRISLRPAARRRRRGETCSHRQLLRRHAHLGRSSHRSTPAPGPRTSGDCVSSRIQLDCRGSQVRSDGA